MEIYTGKEQPNFYFSNYQSLIEPQTAKEINQHAEKLISQFKEQKTTKNLQRIKNAGITLKEIIDGKFKPLTEWKDRFNEFNKVIPLYEKINGNFTVTGVGFFKKIDR